MKRLTLIVRFLIWISVIGLAAGLWARSPLVAEQKANTAGLSVLKNRVYRTDGAYVGRLDVYLPSPAASTPDDHARRPAVLAIHGGSWIGGSKEEYGPQVVRLASAGYVVFAADYRLARPGHPSWPMALDDLRAAVRWIRSRAADYGIDPERIVAFGTSAGGHLASLLGTFPPKAESGQISSRVQAVVSLYAPSDLVALLEERNLPNDPVMQLAGVRQPKGLAQLREASPLAHVTGDDAPMLLIHGTEDRWVPLEQSRKMGDELARAGVKHRLLIMPDERHGFELEVGVPRKYDLLPDILAFLENVWQGQSRN
jgi:acetyl esterase/lipase